LLLLHGNPINHVTWYAVAARLAERYCTRQYENQHRWDHRVDQGALHHNRVDDSSLRQFEINTS
jgi:hypothetical protein